MSDPVYSLLYVSSATTDFPRDDLLALLERARTNNAKRGITGMLLYKDGNFMQVLEGVESEVNAVFARIEADPRHKGTIILLKRHGERTFKDWTMGFRNLDLTPTDVAGYTDFMNLKLTAEEYRKEPSKAHALLGMFRVKM